MKKVTKIFALVLCTALLVGLVPGFTGEVYAAKKTKCNIGFNKPLELSQYYSGLSMGKSKTLYANYDFNGDGKKDTLTITIKATEKTSYSSIYTCTIKINKKKVVKTEVSIEDYGLWGLSKICLFDLNSKDKNIELKLVFETLIGDYFYLYRFNGKKVKCMGDGTDGFMLKQQANDYLQEIVPEVSVEGFGRLNIEADTDVKGMVKNKIYNTASQYGKDIEFIFTRALKLYSEPDGKKSTANISVNDHGYVTKVKVDKNGNIPYVYVTLKNGKAGWLKLEGEGYGYYNPIVTEENYYCGVA